MRKGVWALLLGVTTACVPGWHDLRGRSCEEDADCGGLRCVQSVCAGDVGPPGVDQPPPNTWRATLPMPDARAFAAAARLADGRVLVCGGREETTPLDSAVVYDPATDAFTPTATLSQARSLHRARRLASGDVLVVGGGEGPLGLLTAEVYLAAEQRFESVPDTPFGIDDPLTAGADAAPVFFGADDDRRTFAFDPAQQSWSVKGQTAAFHSASAAETLLDGRVVVLDAAGVELFDPATGQWTSTGVAAKHHYNHVAVRLQDGRVLTAGGVQKGETRSSSVAQLFTPPNTLVDVASMAEAREDFTATLLPDGRVLVVGGFQNTGAGVTVLASAELFDPATRTWAEAAPLARPRASHQAVLLEDGSVLIVGGYDDERTLDTAERYFP